MLNGHIGFVGHSSVHKVYVLYSLLLLLSSAEANKRFRKFNRKEKYVPIYIDSIRRVSVSTRFSKKKKKINIHTHVQHT